jgi:phosphatidylinositol phospholipase C, epsilon
MIVCHSLTAEPTTVKRSLHTLQVPVVYAEELDSLYKLLHFPEEVALRLTATEHHLFYQVPPIDYLRQVTHDLAAPPSFGNAQETPAAGNAAAAATVSAAPPAPLTNAKPTVKDLIKRFNEVNN